MPFFLLLILLCNRHNSHAIERDIFFKNNPFKSKFDKNSTMIENFTKIVFSHQHSKSRGAILPTRLIILVLADVPK
jgi:hypothetical protein